MFDISETYGLWVPMNYLVSVTDASGKKYTNKFQNTKKGIVQTVGSGTPIQCTLDYSDDMEGLLGPGTEKKRTLSW